MTKIEFRDSEDYNYVINVPIANQDKPTVLRMWVAYDKGRRYSYYDYSEVKRGFYLYFSLEEVASDYPARILSTHKANCRLFLGEVSRKSKGWYRDFAVLAEELVHPVVEERFAEFELNWEKMKGHCWSGRGSGVGMYCDLYTVITPKEKWLYG